jgi:hypothetical protein
MKRLVSLLLLFGFLLLSASCGDSSLAVPELIQSLRILAIQSEPPEVAPGQTIRLRALVVDPKNRPISLQWFRCQRTVDTGCRDKTDDKRLGNGQELRWTVPKDFLADGLKPLELLKGRELTLTLVAQAGSDYITGIKRVVVSFVPTNINPVLDKVTFRSTANTQLLPEPWSATTNQTYTFQPSLKGNPRQKYPALTQDGNIQYVDEPLFFSWYMTAGALQGGRNSNHAKPSKNWKAPDKATTSRMFVIIRDGRGGTDWKEWKVQVRE